jgi:nucleoid DNA-binding protein
MKNITKKAFIDTVAQRSGKTKGTCARIVDEMLGTIADLVAQDCKITFVGFGLFEKKYVAPRTTRNPQTGEMMETTGHNSMKFKAGSILKERLNQ